VVGSTSPIWVLAFTTNMYIYTVVASLSGFFSATFPLTFAYISDCVSDKQKRAPVSHYNHPNNHPNNQLFF